jgi:hypothetical protein
MVFLNSFILLDNLIGNINSSVLPNTDVLVNKVLPNTDALVNKVLSIK